MPESEANAGAQRRTPTLFAVLTALLALAILAQLVVTFRTGDLISGVGGVWCALAQDLNAGTLYREVVGPDGYGGTRYMPVQIVVLALLERVTGDYRVAGHLATWLAMAGLLAATWLWLRRSGVRPTAVVAVWAVTLATNSGLMVFGGIRGDLLPLACSVLGLALLPDPGEEPRGRRLWLMAGAFALAVLAKFTCVHGLVAACLCLVLRRQVRGAVWLAGATLLGIAAGICVALWASDGRMIASFAACLGPEVATGGLARAPLHFLEALRTADPWTLPILATTLAALLFDPRAAAAHPAGLAVVVALLGTIALFGDPGVDVNHLLDPNLYGLCVLAALCAARPGGGRLLVATLTALAILGLGMLLLEPQRGLLRTGDGSLNQHRQRILAEHLGDPGRGPLLAEEPLLPILAGERARVLDPYMVRHMDLRDPQAMRPLWQELAEGRFRRVILLRDPESDAGRAWYAKGFFGPRFVDHLLRGYRHTATVGPYRVYAPR
ncbi:MAG: hypothetical protein IT458_17265 [Planctomycetes bacterium]|nr:hypothetical protein [Planctomycetota bacterium]